MTDPRYCSNCGTQLSSTARFCASCGQPLLKQNESPSQPESSTVHLRTPTASAQAPAPSTLDQPAPQTDPPAPQERVVGVIAGANRPTGFLGLKMECYIIVLTNQRFIFALQTTQMMKDNIKRAREEAQEEGKGFFGKWGAQLSANSGQQYWQISPQQILSEQPTNYYINLDQIRSIRLREVSGDEDSTSTYYMDFHTVSGKQSYRFGSLNIRALKKELQDLYGDIVR